MGSLAFKTPCQSAFKPSIFIQFSSIQFLFTGDIWTESHGFFCWLSAEISSIAAQGEGKGRGNDGSKGVKDPAENYELQTPDAKTGQESAICQATGRCFLETLTCPAECSQRKPKKVKKAKGCFINCRKGETTCKWRKPNCEGYGSVCYDPQFVGGDRVMFYFHGNKGGNYALVTDDQLQINAHLIGIRPKGRTRDFTWVQALGIIFDSHTLVIAAQRVAKWNDAVDVLRVEWDGQQAEVPTDEEAEWRYSPTEEGDREVVVGRTEDTNSVRVRVAGLVEMDVKARAIGEEENRVHNYQLPKDDDFAHLESQFRFPNLSDKVEGVLGQTYRPGYVNPVKSGVAMPMMGGEDKYHTPSLVSPRCVACRFQQEQPTISAAASALAQY